MLKPSNKLEIWQISEKKPYTDGHFPPFTHLNIKIVRVESNKTKRKNIKKNLKNAENFLVFSNNISSK